MRNIFCVNKIVDLRVRFPLTLIIRHFFSKLKFIRENITFHGVSNIRPCVYINTRLGGRGEITIGANTTIERGAQLITYGGSIHIGRNVFIGPQSIVYGHGGVLIGDDVMIAANSLIIPANHKFDDLGIFINRQDETRIGIKIESNVWIGANVKILDGVIISTGTVIGAGAVVTRSTVANGMYTGAPAKLVRVRGI